MLQTKQHKCTWLICNTRFPTMKVQTYFETCRQSYKVSTIVIYDSRVVPDVKIPILRL